MNYMTDEPYILKNIFEEPNSQTRMRCNWLLKATFEKHDKNPFRNGLLGRNPDVGSRLGLKDVMFDHNENSIVVNPG